jgi:hypothetical protein
VSVEYLNSQSKSCNVGSQVKFNKSIVLIYVSEKKKSDSIDNHMLEQRNPTRKQEKVPSVQQRGVLPRCNLPQTECHRKGCF